MIAEEVKRRMGELGITQGDICRMWKAPKATVSMLVNRKMTSEQLEKRLARLLGVTFEEFRGESGKAVQP